MPRSNTQRDEAEPLQRRSTGSLAASSAARFLVGRDGHGGWIVQDRLGRIGGLFANETAALHFAREECDRNPAEVCQLPENIVLGFDGLEIKSFTSH
ncbi:MULTISPECIES: hypothetical protein [Rhizobium]|uniref:Uncharacterized protein n=1 Tax=Rhizobium tumorigenes TaxID=2041385 RepID=A0AAF1KF83_9HYPH|nr:MULTISPECIES: hypothetical protein [Rhizobium]MBZ5761406.1 hypothetical protein [Rhizobium sp. VS19-DR96]MBZ5767354.1 hypothetical protein [Rhizobium sp. VS19-DR129.2]MBZ5775197.1 hypothetical protein [Rhizobium sp. VS19-DRK62.2]MBZ5785838.1 hypothetical protein [Rhizobium sp. VS19-DR121]MBZ5803264.1 hypothetical protein [Rhizobium sp. VS19-DR181]